VPPPPPKKKPQTKLQGLRQRTAQITAERQQSQARGQRALTQQREARARWNSLDSKVHALNSQVTKDEWRAGAARARCSRRGVAGMRRA
jgi:hypothetical protein